MFDIIVDVLFFCCYGNMCTFLILIIQGLKPAHLKSPMMQ